MFFLPALLLTMAAIFAAVYPLAKAGASSSSDNTVRERRILALVFFIFIPVFSFGFYVAIGRPQLTDQPLAQRADENAISVSLMIQNLESHLTRQPDDMRGWFILARTYRTEKKYDQAAAAYRKIISDKNLGLLAQLGLADSLLSKSQQDSSSEAEIILSNVLKKDSNNLDALYLLAQRKVQQGDVMEAKKLYQRVYNSLPEENPMRKTILNDMKALLHKNGLQS